MHPSITTSVFTSAVMLLTAVGVPDVSYGAAQLDAPETLKERVRVAELIFQGEIVDIVYRMSSQRSEEDERLPHTFVTYQIEQVLKGQTTEYPFTLRILGGLSKERGEFLTFGGRPNFDIGDRSI